MDDLMRFNLYNIYYIYMSLVELRKRIENKPGMRVYLERIDRWIEIIQPIVRELDVCYGVLFGALSIARYVSDETIKRLMSEIPSLSS